MCSCIFIKTIDVLVVCLNSRTYASLYTIQQIPLNCKIPWYNTMVCDTIASSVSNIGYCTLHTWYIWNPYIWPTLLLYYMYATHIGLVQRSATFLKSKLSTIFLFLEKTFNPVFVILLILHLLSLGKIL